MPYGLWYQLNITKCSKEQSTVQASTLPVHFHELKFITKLCLSTVFNKTALKSSARDFCFDFLIPYHDTGMVAFFRLPKTFCKYQR